MHKKIAQSTFAARLLNTEFIIFTGTYAFRLPDDNGDAGLWVSYEDPETAGQKASYVK